MSFAEGCDWECECPESGFCRKLRRQMPPRSHSICNGTSGLSEEKRAEYVQHWGNHPQPVCAHLGPLTGRDIPCPTCTGDTVRLKTHACALYGECLTQRKALEGTPSCPLCSSFTPLTTSP